MSKVLVETRELTKRYGKFTAVDALDLTLSEGEVYGFLGPNGSGKSTTILMLLGLTEPSAGQALVCGVDPTRDPLAVKRQVGYLPENVGFYGDLSGQSNLLYTASLNNIPRRAALRRVEELLEMVDLSGAANQLVGQYSRGMRQRLGLADVLLKDPRMVILDDPTLGLDPAGIQWLLELIEEMSSQRNITIFLSSHQLHEVQRVCHRVGIMSHGKMVLEGSLAELMTQSDSEGFSVELEVVGKASEVEVVASQIPGVSHCEVTGNRLVVTSQQDIRGPLVTTLIGKGVQLLEVRSQNRTLEDIYLRYFQEV
jgi:ABC-2 type transport system ATP-binding protein